MKKQPSDVDGNKRLWQLPAGTELRFEVSGGPMTLKLVSGLAECFGTELALGRAYNFTNVYSSIFTWQGCTLEVEGDCRAYIGEETPMNHYGHVHSLLQKEREEAHNMEKIGPKVMVVGSPDSGKSSICKILANYASRMGEQPLFVDLDIDQGLLTVPGVIAAIPVERPSDIEEGFSSGPAGAAPIAFFCGDVSPEKNPKLYSMQVENLAQVCGQRLASNPEEAAAGLIINTGTLDGPLLKEAINCFSPSVILVVAHDRLYSDLAQDFSSNDDMQLVKLPKSGGVVIRDQTARRKGRETAIKQYFYGPTGTLSPHSLQIPFSTVKIFKTATAPQLSTQLLPVGTLPTVEATRAVETAPSKEIRHSILALSHAAATPALLQTNVCGFLYISDINFERKTMTALAPSPKLPGQFLLLTSIEYVEG